MQPGIAETQVKILDGKIKKYREENNKRRKALNTICKELKIPELPNEFFDDVRVGYRALLFAIRYRAYDENLKLFKAIIEAVNENSRQYAKLITKYNAKSLLDPKLPPEHHFTLEAQDARGCTLWVYVAALGLHHHVEALVAGVEQRKAILLKDGLELCITEPTTILDVETIQQSQAALKAKYGEDKCLLSEQHVFEIDEIKKLADTTGFVNYPNPLDVAVWTGHEKVIKVLLEAKADPNSRDRSLLHFSFQKRKYLQTSETGECVPFSLLLKAGAKDEAKEGQNTILIDAVIDGDEEVVSQLLHYKASDVNHKGRGNKTALSHAVQVKEHKNENGTPKKLVDFTQKLLDAGAHDIKDDQEKTCLMLAAAGGNFSAVDLLLRYEEKAKVNVDAVDNQDANALICAFQSGQDAILDYLLKKTAPTKTPLMIAAEAGNKPTLKKQLEAKVAVDQVDKTGLTALMLAAMRWNFEAVEVLLAAKADPNKKCPEILLGSDTIYDLTALHFAVDPSFSHLRSHKPLAAQIKTIQVLLQYKADATHYDSIAKEMSSILRMTPFHKAVSFCSTAVVQLFVSIPNVYNDAFPGRGRTTPLLLLVHRKNAAKEQLEILQLLTSKIKAITAEEIAESFKVALLNGAARVAVFLTRLNLSLVKNMRFAYGESCLFAVIRSEHFDDKTTLRRELLDFLFTKGADLEERNSRGQTPLMLAAELGRTPLFDWFLARRADFKAKDKSERTVIFYAVLANQVDTINELLRKEEYQINLLQHDADGNTPLHLAAQPATKLALIKKAWGKTDLKIILVKNHKSELPSLDFEEKTSRSIFNLIENEITLEVCNPVSAESSNIFIKWVSGVLAKPSNMNTVVFREVIYNLYHLHFDKSTELPILKLVNIIQKVSPYLDSKSSLVFLLKNTLGAVLKLFAEFVTIEINHDKKLKAAIIDLLGFDVTKDPEVVLKTNPIGAGEKVWKNPVGMSLESSVLPSPATMRAIQKATSTAVNGSGQSNILQPK